MSLVPTAKAIGQEATLMSKTHPTRIVQTDLDDQDALTKALLESCVYLIHRDSIVEVGVGCS